MHPSRLLLAALVLASAPAFAEEPMDAPPRGPVFEATNDPVKLKQQLADLQELSNGMRDQIDTTQAAADAARQEAEVLRQQRDALQARLTGLQRHAQVNEQAPATAAKDAELAKLRAELAAATTARESAAADARNLAKELATTRTDRDKYQRSSIEDRSKVDLLNGDLNACLSGR
jgi:chromosome segregation ATPase